jgi:hypothetical protein
VQIGGVFSFEVLSVSKAIRNLGTFVSPLDINYRMGFLRYTFVTSRSIKGRTGLSSFRYNIFRKIVFESQT